MDDVELITKELIENAIAPKPKKMSASDHAELTQLLVQKDMELKGNNYIKSLSQNTRASVFKLILIKR